MMLGLTGLLAACDSGNKGGTGPTPPAQPRSTISGIVSSPGALGKAQPDSTVLPRPFKELNSWWTDPAAVQARAQARGVGPDGAIPGEFIIKRRSGLSAQRLNTLSVGGVTLRFKSALGLPGVGLYRTEKTDLSAQQTASIVTQLEARSDVVYAEPNHWVHALKEPNDKYYPLQWDAQAMNLPKAWDLTTGKAVTVAVIDSGIVAHPDLKARLLPGMDFVQDPTNAGDGDGIDSDPTDLGDETSYHGSHVAGTIAAATNNGEGIAGVSWGARIVPVRTLGSQGGSIADTLIGVLWAAGYDFTAEGVPLNPNPAQVINMSLGGEGACTQTEQDVYDYLTERGVIVVVAAGNEDQDTRNVSPASCNNVLTVGAIGPDGQRAPYSNFGTSVDVMAPGGNTSLKIKVGGQEIPGGILSTIGDGPGRYAYGLLQGTSMAAPHVAGLVALLKGEQPDMTLAQVEARLKATSVPLSGAACGVANGCGAGLVNAAAALSGTGAGAPEPTPSPTPTPTPPPIAGEIKTLVAALYRLPSGYDESRSQVTLVNQKTLRNPYTLANLEPGLYNVAAWQDLNSNGEVDEGEPFGIYFNPLNNTVDVTVDAVARSIIGIDVDLAPFSTKVSSTTQAQPAGNQPQDAVAAMIKAAKERASTP